MFDDSHYRARGLFESVQYSEGELEVAAIHPRLSETPGRTDRGGPELGEHTNDVLRDYLQLSDAQIAQLRSEKVV